MIMMELSKNSAYNLKREREKEEKRDRMKRTGSVN
jgi:hypothetical protein